MRTQQSESTRPWKAVCIFFFSYVLIWPPILTVAGELQEISFSVSSSYYHSSGSYGLTSTTDIDSVPIYLNYYRGPLFFQMTVPYVRISGFGTVTMGSGGPIQISQTAEQGMYGTHSSNMSASPENSQRGSGPKSGDAMSGMNATAGGSPSSSQSRVTESGLGDITLKAGYGFYPFDPDGLLLEASTLLKLPTADESKGLGTGKTDVSFQIDLSKTLGNLTPFLSSGYTLTGDADHISYNNIVYGSVGGTYTLTNSIAATMSYDIRSKATDNADTFREGSVQFSWQVNDTWKVSALVAAGLTDAVPDWTTVIKAGVSY